MTTTPLATIADALIDFILSLLRDPAAAEEFAEDPEGTMDRAGVGSCSVADVRAVAPVIYDRPDVMARPPQTVYVPTGGGRTQPADPVERAIQNIVNNFHVENRSTVVDQSVNQNIWAEGDVNQIFDQEAVVNTGDNGAAAGDDALVDNSDTAIGGDYNVGNTTTETTVTDSFNDTTTETTTDIDTTVTDSFNDTSAETSNDQTATDSFNESTDNSDSSDSSINGSFNDTTTQAAAEDSSADVSSTTIDSPPEDPFVNDQP